jgi:hypothetical protein
MDAGRSGNKIEHGQSEQQEAKRNECVAEMQDQHEALAPGAVAGPARQPRGFNASWRDANAYAAWLSRRTGESYRLPTDEEWAYAAGSRWQDDGVAIDADDPSRRSLARNERESNLKEFKIDSEPKPPGAFWGERARPARCGGQCVGMDQHLLCAHRARRSREGDGKVDRELRRARGRGPAPHLRDRFHPRRACGRLCRRHPAEQPRFPPSAGKQCVSAVAGPLMNDD